ncbi:MAG: FG-GAP repeat protein, partial [Anaerolineae bacterium]|nr:FG-GAP repeat protein [Anaerolineae bacterium]
MRKRENHNTLSLKKESKMKPHKGGLFSLGRCSHWLTLLALLLLSALPAPLAAGAAPAAASIPTGQSQRIAAGQTPAGLSAADWLSIQAQIEAGPYLKASNTDADDGFGYSVAISGDTLVVGAPGEDSSATGVNGNGGDNSAASAGAAYVFGRSGGVWSQQAYLKASNTGAYDQFGWGVAISGDTVVVGASGEDSSATGVNGDGSNN